jgi:S1-C subfamily serine protease
MVLLLSLLLTTPANLSRRVLPVLGVEGIPIGSATVLTKQLLLTNLHVTGGLKDVVVACGEQEPTAHVFATNAALDLALMVLAKPCELAEPNDLADGQAELGTEIWTVGFPFGELAVGRGVVSAYQIFSSEKEIPTYAARLTAIAFPGVSGGPVLNQQGKLVCVMFSRIIRTGEGACIPILSIRRFLKASQEAE